MGELFGLQKKAIAEALGLLVLLGGLIVMLGWLYDVPALKSVMPDWVTMKFTTALSFMLSGIALLALARCLGKSCQLSLVILPMTCLTIFMIMVSLLTGVFFGIQTGTESLGVKEQAGAVKTAVPGMPNIVTMISFVLIASACIWGISDLREGRPLMLVGWLLVAVGIVAVIGYALSIDMMYYDFGEGFTAMAFHTAVLFAISGITFSVIADERGAA
ncbi:MAG: hypothetical protein AB1295_00100 [Candidatus Micrarchaeota archaeon]